MTIDTTTIPLTATDKFSVYLDKPYDSTDTSLIIDKTSNGFVIKNGKVITFGNGKYQKLYGVRQVAKTSDSTSSTFTINSNTYAVNEIYWIGENDCFVGFIDGKLSIDMANNGFVYVGIDTDNYLFEFDKIVKTDKKIVQIYNGINTNRAEVAEIYHNGIMYNSFPNYMFNLTMEKRNTNVQFSSFYTHSEQFYIKYTDGTYQDITFETIAIPTVSLISGITTYVNYARHFRCTVVDANSNSVSPVADPSTTGSGTLEAFKQELTITRYNNTTVSLMVHVKWISQLEDSISKVVIDAYHINEVVQYTFTDVSITSIDASSTSVNINDSTVSFADMYNTFICTLFEWYSNPITYHQECYSL